MIPAIVRGIVEYDDAQRAKVSKQGALYAHFPGVDYRCRECSMFIPELRRCSIHGKSDVIKPFGYCSYFLSGKPMGHEPMGQVTKLESGYGEDPNGTKCRRCLFFVQPGDCRKVDKDSPGDDPGLIHPEGCCAEQTPREKI